MPSLNPLKKFGSQNKTIRLNTPQSKPQSLLRGLSNSNPAPARTTPTRRPAPPEAPPAYSAAPPLTTVSDQVPAGADSQYAFLAQFDTVFLIDDSGSMAGGRWRETSEALAAITPICTEQDEDGIDIYFLNHRRQNSNLGGYQNVKSPSEVREIFGVASPRGGTPTGTRLNHILRPYLTQLEQEAARIQEGFENTIKPLNIIVITDGEATDDVTSVIVQAARRLDKIEAEPWQIGIQFFQVGKEPGAAQSLQELDDELSDEFNIRDMVDTVPWTGDDGSKLTAEGILKTVLGSVHRKLDRRRGSDELLRE
ncbi:putative von willebrand factor [Phaeomoniella chlamydospora]|uniref:Putative von willebrand factor n=1 Tax=Phaeomoniella chlamydospora TaxID=158046 RepID=A0A0G2EUJ6_PHACM|nr:putative von willebrand factor [Phaeomoniella chlamydospora]